MAARSCPRASPCSVMSCWRLPTARSGFSLHPDAELTRLDINEGSTVTLRDHRLAKAAHKVYFTRHGETVWNVENKICGMTDSPPTEKRPRPGPGAGRKAPDQRSPHR